MHFVIKSQEAAGWNITLTSTQQHLVVLLTTT